ncbi:hypothetical protein ACH5RR_014915 [Cinchona calisaya]|uniref:Uncharacterized protein n=1 Tax=Cinchona calisaya TaxID=153742 RepID=A0ABD2ZRP2_9GENT
MKGSEGPPAATIAERTEEKEEKLGIRLKFIYNCKAVFGSLLELDRPFRLPAILVGDGRLGGISGTISAYESLKLRGYDVVAVVF